MNERYCRQTTIKLQYSLMQRIIQFRFVIDNKRKNFCKNEFFRDRQNFAKKNEHDLNRRQ